MRRLVIVSTLAFGGLFAAYGALLLLDLLARHEIRTSQALVLQAGGGLELQTGSGDVTVQAAGGAPRIEASSNRGLFDGGSAARIVQDASGRLSVRTDCDFPSSLFSCRGNLRVLVPSGTAVEVGAGSGDVDVDGIRGGVVADTGSGNVRLENVGGPDVRVETGSGDISGGGLTAMRLRGETGSGNVELTATGAPDDVFVDTGSGDVEMTVPDETYDVGTQTGSGDQQVTVRSDSRAPRRLRVQTGSGNVTVRPAP